MILTLWRDKTPNHFAQRGELLGLSKPIFTLEDKWRDNARQISCIPIGTYRCVPHGWEANTKVRFPRVWRLVGVKDRDAILIHVGNTHLDTHGCILVGLGRRIVKEEPQITSSRLAIELMRREIGPNEFTLVIK